MMHKLVEHKNTESRVVIIIIEYFLKFLTQDVFVTTPVRIRFCQEITEMVITAVENLRIKDFIFVVWFVPLGGNDLHQVPLVLLPDFYMQ